MYRHRRLLSEISMTRSRRAVTLQRPDRALTQQILFPEFPGVSALKSSSADHASPGYHTRVPSTLAKGVSL